MHVERTEQSRSGDRVQEKQGEIGTTEQILVINHQWVKMTSMTSKISCHFAQTSVLCPQVCGFSSLCGFPFSIFSNKKQGQKKPQLPYGITSGTS